MPAVGTTRPSEGTCATRRWDGMWRTLCLLGVLGSGPSLFLAEYELQAFSNHMGSENKANTMEIGMQNERKEWGKVILWKPWVELCLKSASFLLSGSSVTPAKKKNPSLLKPVGVWFLSLIPAVSQLMKRKGGQSSQDGALHWPERWHVPLTIHGREDPWVQEDRQVPISSWGLRFLKNFVMSQLEALWLLIQTHLLWAACLWWGQVEATNPWTRVLLP